MNVVWIQAISILLLAVACSPEAAEIPDPRADVRVRWTSLAVSSEQGQADAHLLQFPKNHNILIDAGESREGDLALQLKKQRVKHLDKIYLSHAHLDHYAGIRQLLKQGFSIGEVYLNLPSKAVCDTELGWGCDWEGLKTLTREITDKGIPIKSMAKGDLLYDSDGIVLKVLYAYTCEDNPFGVDKIGVNDMSVIMRLDNGTSSALFTGDLDLAAGTHLADHGQNLDVDLLKIPHHGADSVAPNTFLEKTQASAAIVPAQKSLWDGLRNARIRDWLTLKALPTYVTGINGVVSVRIYPDTWKFE